MLVGWLFVCFVICSFVPLFICLLWLVFRGAGVFWGVFFFLGGGVVCFVFPCVCFLWFIFVLGGFVILIVFHFQGQPRQFLDWLTLQ